MSGLSLRTGYFNFKDTGNLYQLGGDSGRFTQAAEDLINNYHIPTKSWLYLSYVLFLSTGYFFRLGFNDLVIIQMVLSFFSLIGVYRITTLISKSKISALISVSLMIINFDLMKWHTYLLSDSLFITMQIFSVWALIKALTDRHYSGISLTLCWLSALIRPNGYLLILAWLFIHFQYSRILFIINSLIFIIFLTFASHKAQERSIFEYSLNGEIIWSYPDLRVRVPSVFIEQNSLLSASISILSHPVTFFKLFLSKVIVEAIRVRPFLPFNYNIFLAALIWPLYPMAIYGFSRLKLIPPVKIIVLLFITNLIFTGLTYADWDGRFLSASLPLLYILAGVGLKSILDGIGYRTDLKMPKHQS